MSVALGLTSDAQQKGSVSATITGRVTTALTGEPIRGATVQATSNGREPAIALRATTDDQGYFHITELPPGQYRVSASRTGFVMRQLGQRGPFEGVDPVSVRPGQVLNADFVLTRGGAISGRVFDTTGAPLAEVRMQAMRIQIANERRRLVPVGPSRLTDDLGVYRLYGLPPGEYLVTATIGSEVLTIASNGSSTLFVNGVMSGSRTGGSTSGYAPTYFPGTARVDDAYRINVSLAEEEDNVNFALVPARLVTVTGTVLNRTGEPIQARIELTPDIDGLRTSAHGTVSDPDGRFSINGVPPGSYHAYVLGRIVEDNPPDVAWFPVEIDFQDVPELTVITNNGSTAAGRIVIEGSSRPSTEGMRLIAQPLGAMSGRAAVGAPVNAGAFQISGLIGPYALTFDGIPPGLAISSITANGSGVTNGSLEFRGSEFVDLQVTITNRLSELYGTVRNQGKAVPRASVLVFPDDPAGWTGASRTIRTARTDENGDFAIRALLTNQRYLVVAVEYLNDGDDQDPEFLQRMKPHVSVLAASTEQNRTMDLTLVTR